MLAKPSQMRPLIDSWWARTSAAFYQLPCHFPETESRVQIILMVCWVEDIFFINPAFPICFHWTHNRHSHSNHRSLVDGESRTNEAPLAQSTATPPILDVRNTHSPYNKTRYYACWAAYQQGTRRWR
jgi:hypothetical protein